MKEYKILETENLEHAEAVMNDMAQAGWRTVGFTAFQTLLDQHFAVALEREVQE